MDRSSPLRVGLNRKHFIDRRPTYKRGVFGDKNCSLRWAVPMREKVEWQQKFFEQ